jgi:hypothetical protein
MNFINLTPHAVRVIHDKGELTFEPSGKIARCEEFTKVAHNLNGVELVYRNYGKVENLPGPDVQTMYIVSVLVRLAVPERYDVVSPGDLIRDDDGNIIGCKNLVLNTPNVKHLFTSINKDGTTKSFQIDKR